MSFPFGNNNPDRQGGFGDRGNQGFSINSGNSNFGSSQTNNFDFGNSSMFSGSSNNQNFGTTVNNSPNLGIDNIASMRNSNIATADFFSTGNNSSVGPSGSSNVSKRFNVNAEPFSQRNSFNIPGRSARNVDDSNGLNVGRSINGPRSGSFKDFHGNVGFSHSNQFASADNSSFSGDSNYLAKDQAGRSQDELGATLFMKGFPAGTDEQAIRQYFLEENALRVDSVTINNTEPPSAIVKLVLPRTQTVDGYTFFLKKKKKRLNGSTLYIAKDKGSSETSNLSYSSRTEYDGKGKGPRSIPFSQSSFPPPLPSGSGFSDNDNGMEVTSMDTSNRSAGASFPFQSGTSSNPFASTSSLPSNVGSGATFGQAVQSGAFGSGSFGSSNTNTLPSVSNQIQMGSSANEDMGRSSYFSSSDAYPANPPLPSMESIHSAGVPTFGQRIANPFQSLSGSNSSDTFPPSASSKPLSNPINVVKKVQDFKNRQEIKNRYLSQRQKQQETVSATGLVHASGFAPPLPPDSGDAMMSEENTKRAPKVVNIYFKGQESNSNEKPAPKRGGKFVITRTDEAQKEQITRTPRKAKGIDVTASPVAPPLVKSPAPIVAKRINIDTSGNAGGGDISVVGKKGKAGKNVQKKKKKSDSEESADEEEEEEDDYSVYSDEEEQDEGSSEAEEEQYVEEEGNELDRTIDEGSDVSDSGEEVGSEALGSVILPSDDASDSTVLSKRHDISFSETDRAGSRSVSNVEGTYFPLPHPYSKYHLAPLPYSSSTNAADSASYGAGFLFNQYDSPDGRIGRNLAPVSRIELQNRSQNSSFSGFEKTFDGRSEAVNPRFCVSIYERSAAGIETNVEKLRPPRVLVGVLDTLIERVLDADLGDSFIKSDSSEPTDLENTVTFGFTTDNGVHRLPHFHEIQSFLWDRFRSIAKEFATQNYSPGGRNDAWAQESLERIVRAHILFNYELCGGSGSVAFYMHQGRSSRAHLLQQNEEQLAAHLKSLVELYQDAQGRSRMFNGNSSISESRDASSQIPKLRSPNLCEFLAYSLIFYLTDAAELSQALKRLQTFGRDVLEHPLIVHAIRCSRAFTTGDYHLFLRLFHSLDGSIAARDAEFALYDASAPRYVYYYSNVAEEESVAPTDTLLRASRSHTPYLTRCMMARYTPLVRQRMLQSLSSSIRVNKRKESTLLSDADVNDMQERESLPVPEKEASYAENYALLRSLVTPLLPQGPHGTLHALKSLVSASTPAFGAPSDFENLVLRVEKKLLELSPAERESLLYEADFAPEEQPVLRLLYRLALPPVLPAAVAGAGASFHYDLRSAVFTVEALERLLGCEGPHATLRLLRLLQIHVFQHPGMDSIVFPSITNNDSKQIRVLNGPWGGQVIGVSSGASLSLDPQLGDEQPLCSGLSGGLYSFDPSENYSFSTNGYASGAAVATHLSFSVYGARSASSSVLSISQRNQLTSIYNRNIISRSIYRASLLTDDAPESNTNTLSQLGNDGGALAARLLSRSLGALALISSLRVDLNSEKDGVRRNCGSERRLIPVRSVFVDRRTLERMEHVNALVRLFSDRGNAQNAAAEMEISLLDELPDRSAAELDKWSCILRCTRRELVNANRWAATSDSAAFAPVRSPNGYFASGSRFATDLSLPDGGAAERARLREALLDTTSTLDEGLAEEPSLALGRAEDTPSPISSQTKKGRVLSEAQRALLDKPLMEKPLAAQPKMRQSKNGQQQGIGTGQEVLLTDTMEREQVKNIRESEESRVTEQVASAKKGELFLSPTVSFTSTTSTTPLAPAPSPAPAAIARNLSPSLKDSHTEVGAPQAPISASPLRREKEEQEQAQRLKEEEQRRREAAEAEQARAKAALLERERQAQRAIELELQKEQARQAALVVEAEKRKNALYSTYCLRVAFLQSLLDLRNEAEQLLKTLDMQLVFFHVNKNPLLTQILQSISNAAAAAAKSGYVSSHLRSSLALQQRLLNALPALEAVRNALEPLVVELRRAFAEASQVHRRTFSCTSSSKDSGTTDLPSLKEVPQHSIDELELVEESSALGNASSFGPDGVLTQQRERAAARVRRVDAAISDALLLRAAALRWAAAETELLQKTREQRLRFLFDRWRRAASQRCGLARSFSNLASHISHENASLSTQPNASFLGAWGQLSKKKGDRHSKLRKVLGGHMVDSTSPDAGGQALFGMLDESLLLDRFLRSLGPAAAARAPRMRELVTTLAAFLQAYLQDPSLPAQLSARLTSSNSSSGSRTSSISNSNSAVLGLREVHSLFESEGFKAFSGAPTHKDTPLLRLPASPTPDDVIRAFLMSTTENGSSGRSLRTHALICLPWLEPLEGNAPEQRLLEPDAVCAVERWVMAQCCVAGGRSRLLASSLRSTTLTATSSVVQQLETDREEERALAERLTTLLKADHPQQEQARLLERRLLNGRGVHFLDRFGKCVDKDSGSDIQVFIGSSAAARMFHSSQLAEKSKSQEDKDNWRCSGFFDHPSTLLSPSLLDTVPLLTAHVTVPLFIHLYRNSPADNLLSLEVVSGIDVVDLHRLCRSVLGTSRSRCSLLVTVVPRAVIGAGVLSEDTSAEIGNSTAVPVGNARLLASLLAAPGGDNKRILRMSPLEMPLGPLVHWLVAGVQLELAQGARVQHVCLSNPLSLLAPISSVVHAYNLFSRRLGAELTPLLAESSVELGHLILTAARVPEDALSRASSEDKDVGLYYCSPKAAARVLAAPADALIAALSDPRNTYFQGNLGVAGLTNFVDLPRANTPVTLKALLDLALLRSFSSLQTQLRSSSATALEHLAYSPFGPLLLSTVTQYTYSAAVRVFVAAAGMEQPDKGGHDRKQGRALSDLVEKLNRDPSTPSLDNIPFLGTFGTSDDLDDVCAWLQLATLLPNSLVKGESSSTSSGSESWDVVRLFPSLSARSRELIVTPTASTLSSTNDNGSGDSNNIGNDEGNGNTLAVESELPTFVAAAATTLSLSPLLPAALDYASRASSASGIERRKVDLRRTSLVNALPIHSGADSPSYSVHQSWRLVAAAQAAAVGPAASRAALSPSALLAALRLELQAAPIINSPSFFPQKNAESKAEQARLGLRGLAELCFASLRALLCVHLQDFSQEYLREQPAGPAVGSAACRAAVSALFQKGGRLDDWTLVVPQCLPSSGSLNENGEGSLAVFSPAQRFAPTFFALAQSLCDKLGAWYVETQQRLLAVVRSPDSAEFAEFQSNPQKFIFALDIPGRNPFIPIFRELQVTRNALCARPLAVLRLLRPSVRNFEQTRLFDYLAAQNSSGTPSSRPRNKERVSARDGWVSLSEMLEGAAGAAAALGSIAAVADNCRLRDSFVLNLSPLEVSRLVHVASAAALLQASAPDHPFPSVSGKLRAEKSHQPPTEELLLARLRQLCTSLPAPAAVPRIHTPLSLSAGSLLNDVKPLLRASHTSVGRKETTVSPSSAAGSGPNPIPVLQEDLLPPDLPVDHQVIDTAQLIQQELNQSALLMNDMADVLALGGSRDIAADPAYFSIASLIDSKAILDEIDAEPEHSERFSEDEVERKWDASMSTGNPSGDLDSFGTSLKDSKALDHFNGVLRAMRASQTLQGHASKLSEFDSILQETLGDWKTTTPTEIGVNEEEDLNQLYQSTMMLISKEENALHSLEFSASLSNQYSE